MYDLFARRYGYTIDEFYSLTSRQIAALVPVIDTNSHREFESQASLHGKKVKPRPETNLLNTDDETEKAQDKDAADLHNRMKARYLAEKFNEST